eukprot:GHVU01006050.1.p1 GENE.GHVU01006050.1~~GHVU01006050.1.p1  ORF type:complete len:160 (-),score=5.31 GHVU01006050.1:167-646(-)
MLPVNFRLFNFDDALASRGFTLFRFPPPDILELPTLDELFFCPGSPLALTDWFLPVAFGIVALIKSSFGGDARKFELGRNDVPDRSLGGDPYSTFQAPHYRNLLVPSAALPARPPHADDGVTDSHGSGAPRCCEDALVFLLRKGGKDKSEYDEALPLWP